MIKRGIRVGLALRCKQIWLSLHSIGDSDARPEASRSGDAFAAVQ